MSDLGRSIASSRQQEVSAANLRTIGVVIAGRDPRDAIDRLTQDGAPDNLQTARLRCDSCFRHLPPGSPDGSARAFCSDQLRRGGDENIRFMVGAFGWMRTISACAKRTA